MRVLFVAYYFEPYEGVGAKRISYWAKHIKRNFPDIKRCDVVTAIKQEKNIMGIDNVYYVKNTNQGLLRKIIQFDSGASWYHDLKNFVDKHIKKNDYDFVLLSGDPFLHFFIINKFKKKNITTILDFRDPFANNPRRPKADTIFKKIKIFILRKIEEYFLFKTDIVITVNKYCIKLFENYKRYKSKIVDIDNGYDEQKFKDIYCKRSKTKNIRIVYAGKLYSDRNPQIFFQCFKKYKNIKFYHIGEKSEYIEKNTFNIKSLGFMDYHKTLKLMSISDICIIFTSGYDFESTTKIFDYIALNKAIMIVTDGEIKTGQLNEITKNYPLVYWVKNDHTQIETTLNKITEDRDKKIVFDSYKYSREYSLKQLMKILYAYKNINSKKD